ncbi:MAG: NUDIX domain-containing protein, partial [Candidatus Nanohalobium sp.]
MSSKDTNRVVQTVIRTGEKYLIAKREEDSYWEFMGGKVKENENLRQAAKRELNEETDLGLEKQDFKEFREGESYKSKADSKYELNPVLIEISEEKASEMSIEGLSEEHTDFEWIDLREFYSFETLGQFKALENLEIVNGDVALPVPEREGEYLLLK